MENQLHVTGAFFMCLFGFLAIVSPKLMAKIVSIIPKGKQGISEIRAVYGGWILGLGAYALWDQSLVIFHCLGISWLLAATFRMISFLIDKSYSSKNLRMTLYELLFATLFLIKV